MGFAFFAGIHYWFPKIYGRMYNIKLANVAWVILFVGFNILYFPLFIIGLQGMPRRYYDYLPQFHTGHFISTMGAYILSVGLILMIYNFMRSSQKGSVATANPWGSKSIEWTIPSPRHWKILKKYL
jgi:cytochrome c oxidase subunit 1